MPESDTALIWRAPFPRSYVNFLGHKLLRFLGTVQGLVAFLLITLGVLGTNFRVARPVIRPLLLKHLARAGLYLLPMTTFLALALGLVVIGQTVSQLTRFGVTQLLGTVMVSAIVRELGPLLAAGLVLCRAGAANVVELGTARAQGEVESLESLGIDPIHYLVVPRVVGMAVGMFALTVYLIIGSILSGYLWAFAQDVPLRPGDYFRQLAEALNGLDFLLLAAKTFAFGTAISVITCYHGLAQPLALSGVSRATVRAVGQSLIACAIIDAVFIIVYLVA
ncbi:MAG: phospholipid/cholesterol/gamma-HCH transport system permease protein [Verrucomicrobiota bacterium]|jgi:phospholipid/cholesterol/gamma-HCH transport system permease protein